jgi:hypothetical protein
VRRSVWLALAAVLVIVLVVFVIVPKFSTTTVRLTDAEPGSTASVSAGPTAPATPGCAATFRMGHETWPDCSDTGAPTGVKLKRMSGVLKLTTNGEVLDHVYITGSVDVYADNVTIENSVVLGTGYIGIMQRSGYSGLKLLHDTITGDPGAGPDSGGEDIGVWNVGGSIQIGYDNISEFGGDVDIVAGDMHDSYLHDEQAFGSTGIGGCKPLPSPIPARCYDHSDAFGIDTGHGIVLRHNTILEASIPGANAAVELDDDLGTVSNVTVTDNFIAGGNYCTYSGSMPNAAPSAHIVYRDNAFSTLYAPSCGQFGPVAYWNAAGTGSIWKGNYWAGGRYSGRSVRSTP